MTIHTAPSKHKVAIDFSEYFKTLIGSNQQEVHIALSGGSTPKIVFDELAANFNDAINWQKVHLYWGDERCVPPTDDQSNYKMTLDHLISKITIPKKNIHRIKGENEPDYEARRYAELLLKKLPKSSDGVPSFDLIILGLGDDGHTASIFPHEIELWHSRKLCEVATHPNSGQKRVSLTGKVINRAKNVTFLVTGENKAPIVDEIFNKKGKYEKYPANLVSPNSGKLIWFFDESAALKIM